MKRRARAKRAADDAWADGMVSWIAQMRMMDAPRRYRPLPYPSRGESVSR
jgi:hypothetical protein